MCTLKDDNLKDGNLAEVTPWRPASRQWFRDYILMGSRVRDFARSDDRKQIKRWPSSSGRGRF